ncbi:polysaccharide biosynthesis/export family protein [Glaciecola sp. KUL10]|uniref:polysaccharide biosynthesis/export family protein n=1 Tax=Glaciecola sp. (strain KUL10) TaxID=2161813 RepID=UPI000D78C4FC|nr:polysaccharide biosynthesis/export family protein [Glaciecola sp. KUL10]GBL04867.1 polysaccharide export periplasmic protein [Glaciecola sp. KUL10]
MQKFYRCFLVFIAVSAFFSTAQSQQLNVDQYTLGAGDMIEITVFGQEDLTVETRLSNTGTISYPFMGDIELVGLTLNQVEQLIDDGLRGDYLVNPSVSVSVIEYRPFFIDGEVNRPGGYPYQPGLTITKAAALAGGFTERAAKDKVTIVRMIAGQEQTFQASDKDMIFPGDIVTIQQRFF